MTTIEEIKPGDLVHFFSGCHKVIANQERLLKYESSNGKVGYLQANAGDQFIVKRKAEREQQ